MVGLGLRQRPSRVALLSVGVILVALLLCSPTDAKSGGRGRSSSSGGYRSSSSYRSYRSYNSYRSYRSYSSSRFDVDVSVGHSSGYYRYQYNDYNGYNNNGGYYNSNSYTQGGGGGYAGWIVLLLFCCCCCFFGAWAYRDNRKKIEQFRTQPDNGPSATQDQADRAEMFTKMNPPMAQAPDYPHVPKFMLIPHSNPAIASSVRIEADCVSFVPMAGSEIDRCVQTSARVSYYYEITIEAMGPGVCLGVGFATKPYPADRFPGWNNHSVAIHSDSGNMFFNDDGDGKKFSAPFGVGDTVGCGYTIMGTSLSFYFTKNGIMLGNATATQLLNSETWGCIGADGACTVRTNFVMPFRYQQLQFPPAYQQMAPMAMAAPVMAAPMATPVQFGQPPQGQFGQPPPGQFGGQPPQGQFGQPPQGQFGQPPQGQFGQPPQGQFGQPPPGQYGGQPSGYPAAIKPQEQYGAAPIPMQGQYAPIPMQGQYAPAGPPGYSQ